MRATAIGLVMLLSLGACSGEDEAFCDAARAFNELDAASDTGLEDAQEAFRNLADEAPEEIKEDARFIAEAIEDAASGDIAGVSDPEFQEAVNRVQSYGEENCSGLE